MHTFVPYGVGNWFPSFLARMHNVGSGEIGTWLALGSGIGGGLGTWLGGYLGDKLGQTDRKWYLLPPSIAILLSVVFTMTILFTSHKMLRELPCFLH